MTAFSNYQDLQNGIASWLMRGDLTSHIPTFIRMAESAMDRDLLVKELVERRTSRVTAQYVELPHNWAELRNVQRLSDRQPLKYLPMDDIDRYRADIAAGRRQHGAPTHYSLLGRAMELVPSPTPEAEAVIELVYYATVPKLADDAPTNVVLQTYPDLYLYGALVHSAPFLKDDARIAVWERLFLQALASANAADRRGRHSGASLTSPTRTFGV